jgi:phosphatidylglycerol lysyltransferase
VRLRALAIRQLPVLILAGFAVALFSDRLRNLDAAALLDALGRVTAGGAAVALALAALSFAAVARYDALVHRLLATGQREAVARRAGFAATAISQTTGFGLLVGTLVRLRLMPGLTLGLAVAVTAAAAALFLGGWAVVTATAVVALPSEATRHFAPLALAVLAIVPLALAASFLLPQVRVAGRVSRLPPPGILLALIGLAAVDTLAAALCLWSLLPPGSGVLLAALLPAFLVAYGAGLVSGSPGGIGVFEVTFLALLPGIPAEPVLAGILAWRLVYYAGPALLAGLLLVRATAEPASEEQDMANPIPTQACGAPAAPALRAMVRAPRAEFGLVRQSDKAFLPLGPGGAVVARAGHTLALIGAPSDTGCYGMAIDALTVAAQAEARRPCFYKAPARLAAGARARGWTVAPVALEGFVDPRAFDPATPPFRQLRRKLKKAADVGVEVRRVDADTVDWSAADRIAADWSEARGGERGLSMGRYARDYVRAQLIFMAYRDADPVAFITLHQGRAEWALDLMRSKGDAPDGTMQALIAAAIAQAREAGLRRLSLAAIPHPALEDYLSRLARMLHRTDPAGGLARFKQGFAPRWEPVYCAAPSRPALVLCAFDLLRAIDRPPRLASSAEAPPCDRINHALATSAIPSPVLTAAAHGDVA